MIEKLNKENLDRSLKEATNSLLEMARMSCWNKISNNTSYIISEILNEKGNFIDKRIERKKVNEKKQPISIEGITAELKDIYDNLYDINLYIYKSEKDKTIIEVQYFPKSLFESDFYETIKYNEPMLHCKVSVPSYVGFKSEKKFDVNWELGGIRYEWNHLIGKIKYHLWKYDFDKRKRLQNKNVG